jgi:hypothetical protein
MKRGRRNKRGAGDDDDDEEGEEKEGLSVVVFSWMDDRKYLIYTRLEEGRKQRPRRSFHLHHHQDPTVGALWEAPTNQPTSQPFPIPAPRVDYCLFIR